MENTKISVVIPVYNTAPYLDKCLCSVLEQRDLDLEIIVVDDGSTDDSASILARYAAKDSRVTVIRQPNSGVVVARQRAIERASGRFLFFLDSDDYLDADTFGQLLACQREDDLDMVCGGYLRESPSYTLEWGRPVEGVITGKEYLKELLYSRREGYLCGILYKKKLFDGIACYPDLHVSEDLITNIQVVLNGDIRIGGVFRPFYHYVQRGGSATRTRMDAAYMKKFIGYVSDLVQMHRDTVPEGTLWLFMLKYRWFLSYVNGTSNPGISGDPFAAALYDEMRDSRIAAEIRRNFSALQRLTVKAHRYPATAFLGKTLTTVGRISASVRKRLPF